jgi:hypothetical protein
MRYLHASEVLVRCPRCSARAAATSSRVACSTCGFARTGDGPMAFGARATAVVQGRCGRCGRKATVERSVRGAISPVPVRCEGCGTVTRHGVLRMQYTGVPESPRFHGLDLWLQTPCEGRVLWAYDAAHLDFLERYVAAGLREQEPGNASLASRLPAWIKSRKNRGTVTRGLKRLRAMLPE